MAEVTNQEPPANDDANTPEQPDPQPESSPVTQAPAAENDDSKLDEETKDSARYVNNVNFYGSVWADGAVFGSASGTAPGRDVSATGPLRAEDVTVALRHYVKPLPFAEAKRLLEERRMVVLCGREGIGRYASAIALLRAVTGPKHLPTNLSPALTFAELAAQKFANAGGYIVRDQLRDGNTTAVQQFEVQRLLGVLKGRSYLVITTDIGVRPRGNLADLMVDWAAPDRVELFDTCVTNLFRSPPAGPEAAAVREQISRLTSPRHIVKIASLLIDSPARALTALQSSERDRVADWFAKKPTVREVLTVAALAFVDGTPESNFEQLLARLVELHRTVGGSSTTPAAKDGAGGMDQSRAWALTNDFIIVRTQADDPNTTPERSVCFTSHETRALVIRELHERYGYELWEPLRTWLHEIAARPMSFLHVRLGLGMALLAKCTFSEVEHQFLYQWSTGLAPERLAAACTLSWIGIDGTYASAALAITKRWSRNSGPRRAATAATALGGPLGLRYSSDALRWLWLLAMRNAQIRQVACIALNSLFSASVNDVAATRRVLNFLRNRIEEALLPGGSQRDRRAVYDTVLSVLCARDSESDEPVAAIAIRQDARNASRLGSLWAELLLSGPHRPAARRALFNSLESLSATPDALPAVGELGSAARAVLSPKQWEDLVTSLEQVAKDRADGSSDRPLITSVLAALRGRTTARNNLSRRAT